MPDIVIEVPTDQTYIVEVPVGPQGPQGPQGEPGVVTWPGETTWTVSGGTDGTQPTFTGAPLFVGKYVLQGDLLHFNIQVDFTNITSFGTGQYYLDLPFDVQHGTMFRNGCLHRLSNGNLYAIGGHVYPGSNRMRLTYTGSNGHDEVFDYNSPFSLTTADAFHIAGTYVRLAD